MDMVRIGVGGVEPGEPAAPRLVVTADFDDFYVHSYKRTLGLALSLTGDWGHAEDLVQDAYTAAHKGWAALSTYDDPAAWIRRAVLNRAVSRRRRFGREIRALTRVSARRGDLGHDTEPYDERFWKAVATLPRQQAKVVALYYVEDLSVADVALVLGCSVGAVKTHLSRARHTLHARFIDTPEIHEVRDD